MKVTLRRHGVSKTTLRSCTEPDIMAAETAEKPKHEVDKVEGEKAAPRAEAAPLDGDTDPAETREWLDSLEGVLEHEGPRRARFLLSELKDKAIRSGVVIP